MPIQYDMVHHMKTTIEIPDALFEEAKSLAAKSRTTLKALVEAGLRDELRRRSEKGKPYRLPDASVRGKGLRPEYPDLSWDRIREVVYEGHGG